MKKAALAFGWALGIGLVTTGFTQVPNVTINYSETLQDVRVSQQNRETTLGKSSRDTGTSLSIVFDAHGQHFNLILEDNTSLLPLFKTQTQNVRLLRGRLRDKPDSWARISLFEDTVTGMIYDDKRIFVIEPKSRKDPYATGETIIYRLDDVSLSGLFCGSDNLDAPYTRLLREITQHVDAKTPVATREITVSLMAGQIYRTNWASRAIPDMLASLNAVDGIFSEQLGIQIRVVESDVTLTPDTDGEIALQQVALLRQNKPALQNTGLSHLFTAVNLAVDEEGTTKDIVGIAYIDVLCDRNWGVGITEVGNRFVQDALVTAHELGHNFSAFHDGESMCSNVAADNFIMAARYNGFPEFSQCSIQQIQTAASKASCLSSLSRVDIQVTSPTHNIQALLNQDFSFTYEVANRGSADTNNVGLDIVSTDDLSILQAVPSSGVCTEIPSGVHCNFGEISIGASRIVDVTSRASATGELQIVARAQALGDVAPGNDQFNIGVNVAPAVGLSLVFDQSTRTIDIDESMESTLRVTNDAVSPATDLAIQLNVPTGLQIQAIETSLGNCSITAVHIQCHVALLDTQGTFDISFSILGKAAGLHTIEASISSAQVDLDPSNDSAVLTLTVGTTNPAVSNTNVPNGGGVILLDILLLFFLRASRLWRITRCQATFAPTISKTCQISVNNSNGDRSTKW